MAADEDAPPGGSSPGFTWWPAFVALTWAFHIAVDRLLGYGLKFTDRFSHTLSGRSARCATGPGRPEHAHDPA